MAEDVLQEQLRFLVTRLGGFYDPLSKEDLL